MTNSTNSLLDKIPNIKNKKIEITNIDGILKFSSNLDHNTHEYIYSDPIPTPQGVEEFFYGIWGYPAKNLGCALVFYDKDGNKLDGKTGASNQLNKVTTPENAKNMRLGIRFFGPGEGSIFYGIVDTYDESIKKIGHLNKFKSTTTEDMLRINAARKNTPLILIETVFCDTEKNEAIINRFLSYFTASIYLISFSRFINFRWMIHISEDKSDAIKHITDTIQSAHLEGKVFVNIYTHPSNGYGTDDDHHIMRARCPNIAIPERRDILTKNFHEKIKKELHKDLVVIRVAIDDDDFFAPSHLDSISNLSLKNLHKIVTKNASSLAIGNARAWVSTYIPGGGVEVVDVSLNRMMTGNKFSVAIGEIPLSPFAISEIFHPEEMLSGSTLYIREETETPTFSYNRHGANFSNASKSSFVTKQHNSYYFKTQYEMILHFSEGA